MLCSRPISATCRQSVLGGILQAVLGLSALLAQSIQLPELPELEMVQLRPTARIDSDQIAESSGLVASRQFEGVLWTLNDSGDRARIFALSLDGTVLSEIEVQGAINLDWEDIAIDDHGRLYLGDIGNNANQRRDLAVYVVAEPDPRAAPGAIEVEKMVRFRYPDLPYPPPQHQRNFDAESLFVAGDRLYLLTKHRSNTRTRLYRFPFTLTGESLSHQHVLEPVGEIDLEGSNSFRGGMATAADATPDGRYLAVLSYHALFLFERPASGDNYLENAIRRIDLTRNRMRQCESIAWYDQDLWIGNEQRDLFRFESPLSNIETGGDPVP